MQISKRTSQITALLLAITFIVSVSLYLRDTRSTSPASTELKAPTSESANKEVSLPPTDPNSNFVLNTFHRIETKNGKKLWEINGDRGQYYADGSKAKIDNAILVVYRPNGDVVEIRANEATLMIDTATLKNALLVGNVVMDVKDKIRAETSRAIFDKEANTVVSDEEVRFTSKNLAVTGTKFRADLTNEVFNLEQDIDSVISSRS